MVSKQSRARILGTVLALLSPQIAAQDLVLPVLSVVDGDTVRTSIALPEPLNKVSVRLNGIDTPESTWRAKCPAEKTLGIMATCAVKKLFPEGSVMIVKDYKWGKYGGRIVGSVYTESGINVTQYLIDMGLGEEYHGKTKINWWCP